MKLKNKLFYFLAAVLWLVIFIWNYLTPQYADDLYYIHNSISNIFKQGYNDYFYWNGRIVGQTIMRLLNFGNQFTVSVLNSLVFVVLAILILRLGFKSSEHLTGKFIIVITLLLLFIPAFGQTILWRAGSGNYLWTLVISLFYIYLYIDTGFFNKEKKSTLLSYALGFIFLILAIIVGWSNENTSGGVLLIILINTYFRYKMNFNFSLKYWLGIIANFMGYVMLLISPGNKIRTISTMGTGYLDKNILERFVSGFVKVNQSIADQYIPFFFLILLLFTLMINYWFTKKKLVSSTSWIFSGVATIYALSFSPMGQDGGRSYFGGIIFLIIAICQLLPEDLAELDRFAKLAIELIAISIISYAFLTIPNGLFDSLKANRAIDHSYALIRKEKSLNGAESIIQLPRLSYRPTTKYAVNYGLMEVGTDPDAFPNQGYKLGFRIKGVILQEK